VPVATLSAYEEMWVHPAVVAALSNGLFVYVEYPTWDPAVTYTVGSKVLAGDCPYGGCVYRAVLASTGVDPTADGQTSWTADAAATADRLRVYSATVNATWLLDTLTGYRLHGEEDWQEDYAVHSCTVRLRRQPVMDVMSVVRVDRCNVPASGEVEGWCRTSVNTIAVCTNGAQPLPWYDPYHSYTDTYGGGCQSDVVRVVYRIASNLPPGTEGVVAWLAVEYGKAAQGKTCALPERITNITRQGVSWSILDPQDFLDKGFTGMSRVDNWLGPVRVMLGGQIIDPLTSDRLFSVRVEATVESLRISTTEGL